MIHVISYPPVKSTTDEHFDDDAFLGDALSENMDAVRKLRDMIPKNIGGERVESTSDCMLSGHRSNGMTIIDAAIKLINSLEDYMEKKS